MSKILRYLACLFMLIFAGNALAAGYSCPSYKKYTSCASGYYMTSSSSSTTCNTTAKAGNACRPCSVMGSNYTCAGGTSCPKLNSVTCSAGYYLKANATSCSACGGNNYYCPGGTYNVSSSAQGRNTVSSGYYSTGGTSTTRTGQSACGGNNYYCSAGVRYTVSSGYYSTGGTSTTRTGQSQCTGATYCASGVRNSCPGSYTANTTAGKTSASQCQISVSAGKYIATANSSTQSTCAAGRYKAAHTVNYGSTSSCSTCGAGTYSSSGAASCTACSGSTQYQNLTGQSSCKTVSSGYYKSSNSAQTQCPSGYRDGAGAANINGCEMDVDAGHYVGTANSATQSTCAGGRYKAAHTVNYGSTSSCSTCGAGTYSSSGAASCTACSGSTQYQNLTGQSSCKTVSAGYYKSSNSAQTQCPSGYRDGAGAANVNGCEMDVDAGHYVATANSSTQSTCAGGRYKAAHTVNYGSTSSCLTCDAGTYSSSGAASCTACSGSTQYQNETGQSSCKTVSAGYYKSSNSAQAQCPSGYRDGAGAANQNSCVGSFTKTGSQQTPSMQTGCVARTLGTCAPGTCTYTKQYSGTIVSDCTPTNCTKPQTCTSADDNYYLSGGSAAKCSSSYPYSDGGNISSSYCYKYGTKTGSQVNGSVPTNCASVTSWNSCTPGTCQYKDYNGATDGTCTPSNCTKTPAAVTAKAGYYDAGTSCSACPSAYPNSADDNEGGISKCYMSVSGGKYVATANATSVSTCAAGTYKAAHTVYYGSTSSCSACTGRTKYSAAGASACSTVSSGYYTTGCNTSGNNCTGQSQCTGATYCSGGVQNSCPAQTSGWTRNGGTGWTSYTQCNQTRAATSVSSYCSAGQLKQTATSATAWGASTISTAFQAKAGAYVNGQTCSQCTADNYCTGGTAAPTDCPSGYPNSDAGATAITSCYSNSKSRAWTGSQVNGSVPNNCASVTSWNSCSNPACSYVAYSNSAGTGDGTIKSGCSTNNGNCTKTPAAVTAKAGYYDAGTSCSACPSGYPNSDAGNDGGITKCYSDEKSRPWGGGQISCATPTGCSDSTCNTCTLPACSYVAYSNSTGSADGTIKSGCSTNSEDCQQTVKSVTAKAGRYVSGITCPACAVGTFQGTDDSTATSCTVCAANTYAASTGMSACTACPSGYSTSGTAASNHDAKSDCSITCAAGTRVVTADAACTTPTGSWYTASHSVAAGSTTPAATVKACLTNYSTPNTTTRTDHDASTDCKISCAAGTRVATENATSCTTPAGNWYVGAHSVAQGSISSYSNCLTNYTISGTAAANHDTASDCKISCGGGSYIATANNTTCSDVGAGYWAAASTVSQGSAGVRNACDDGLTTIGSGAGADEVGDCGRVLNVNGEKIYLRSERKTTPSLNVSINGTTFYGNMGASGIGALKLNSGGTTYSVYDDSME